MKLCKKMLVANSFDLWQKDDFFTAAEEVQESADILGSTYRTWLKVKSQGVAPSELHDLQRELQTALGTAKWQLEEFEKAVRSSYGTCRNENRMARRQQFVVAMESQIYTVENALKETLHGEGKLALQWVNLDKEERDDLAIFLSGSQNSMMTNMENLDFTKDLERDKAPKIKAVNYELSASSIDKHTEYQNQTIGSTNDTAIDIPAAHIAEGNAEKVPEEMNNRICQVDRGISTRRTSTFPNLGALKVAIPDYSESGMPEASPKVRGSRIRGCIPFVAVRKINQVSWCLGLSLLKAQNPRILYHRRSFRLMLAVILTFFLFVLFLRSLA